MGIFYHFSHFLEILTGMYFGGFALLGFIEKEAIVSFYDKIKKRQDAAKSAKIVASEFFKTKIDSPYNGIVKFIIACFLFCLFAIFEKIGKLSFLVAHSEISKIATSNSPNVLQKKFFPSFFFAGCFCLVVILLSAVQEANCNSIDCHRSIDFFIIYYIISSVLFQVWSLFIFPRLVNNKDYVHLVFVSIIMCLLFFYLSQKFSRYDHVFYPLEWLLSAKHEMWLICIVLFTALIPLIFILCNTILVFLLWEIPLFFYNVTLKIFNKSEAKNDIQKLI